MTHEVIQKREAVMLVPRGPVSGTIALGTHLLTLWELTQCFKGNIRIEKKHSNYF